MKLNHFLALKTELMSGIFNFCILVNFTKLNLGTGLEPNWRQLGTTV